MADCLGLRRGAYASAGRSRPATGRGQGQRRAAGSGGPDESPQPGQVRSEAGRQGVRAMPLLRSIS
ncbi:unnamed protein product, partial [Effrenium voratum]